MRIDAHVQDICGKVYIDIRRISSIRHILSADAAKTLLSAFVLPKLDHCNYLFHGSQIYMLERLQKDKSTTATLMLQCRKQNHISPLLMPLHWLPINARIEYKLTVFCHSFFLGMCHISSLTYSQCTHPKETYALLLTIKFYVSINNEQGHLGIAYFLLQLPQYEILCPQNSDI